MNLQGNCKTGTGFAYHYVEIHFYMRARELPAPAPTAPIDATPARPELVKGSDRADL